MSDHGAAHPHYAKSLQDNKTPMFEAQKFSMGVLEVALMKKPPPNVS